ncbi:lambda exonuclease family protein [Nocardia flavorosea]|uniref:YqaJ viral recombinase family protein n=1 Tax=Nocardia flavorosea TaxID=53429 RepID=A0A846YTC4_9NOCA|nr:lambda exonuclease family protein [Nocardia flavorosea]NKY60800.1 YqaJ viral recombinase family protein [Nocardia flavorosea]
MTTPNRLRLVEPHTPDTRAWLEAPITVYPDLVQGSDEWLAARRGLVTASVIGDLVTAKTLKPANNDTSRGLTALLVAERITGWTDPTFMSDDMFRGIEDEPRARDIYSQHYAPVHETGFMVRELEGVRIGYSPDGLVDGDGLIEIKSRKSKIHLAHILAGQPPAEVMPQLQCGLLVSGRQWLDYISYCGGMPMWTKRVYPDPRWFEAIIAALQAFEDNAAEMTRLYMERVEGLPVTERVIEHGLVF